MNEHQIQAIDTELRRFRRSYQSSSEDDPIEETLRRIASEGAARLGIVAGEESISGRSARIRARSVARLIDHTALKPDATPEDIRTTCEEARRFSFASVCVNPCYVGLVAEWLAGSPVAACTVVGFPLGGSRPETKVFEAERAVDDGAAELDMVLNVGMLKSREYDYVEYDIRAVVDAVRRNEVTTKVILETALLTDEEKVIACLLARNAGADFVKTSTGFSKGGATTSDVALMRRVVGKQMGVKASGGIRSAADAEKMVAHGATRIGASASVKIVREGEADGLH